MTPEELRNKVLKAIGEASVGKRTEGIADAAIRVVLEASAKEIKARFDDILKEEGFYDSTTGVTELPESAEIQLEELEWSITTIRSLLPQDKQEDAA